MTQSWIKVVPLGRIENDKEYFLAKPPHGDYPPSSFYSSDINGKTIISGKPGIAIRFSADTTRQHLTAHPETLIALEVPADADKRWRRRIKRRNK